MHKRQGCQITIVFLLSSLPIKSFAEPSLCRGPTALLEIIDRPTIASSPCTVPDGHAELEFGFQALKLVYTGHAQLFPSTEFRIGLPADNEFFALLPSYNHVTLRPSSGFGSTGVGLKHIIKYTDSWIFTVNSLIIPPSGSVNFGNKELGGILNGIFSYNLSDKLSFTAQLGVSTLTESEFSGGQRFNSINPDAFLSWSLTDNLQIYGEIYGQSKTAVGAGSGFNLAAGFIFLIAKNISFDIEGGQRLSGLLGDVENYVGLGAAVQF